MSLPSEKYRKQLLPIKKQLMKEIVSYFKYDKFEMIKDTIINYQIAFGEFSARFDTIIGNETKFKLYWRNGNLPDCVVMKFDCNELAEIEKDIPFLMKLIDYINMDAQKVRENS